MPPRLALIFSFNVSLEIWHRQGLLDREKLIYERLLASGAYQGIDWFTYGVNDIRYQNLLKEGITIVSMPRVFNSLPGRLVYSMLMPFIHADRFRKCTAIKTNQMVGSWTAVVAAKFHGRPLMARTGFTWSRNAARQRIRKLDRFASLSERLIYRTCDVAVVTDRSQARYVAERYGLALDRVKVIPNYIDVDAFRPDSAEPIKDPMRALYIGRLSTEKNLENLVIAFGGLPYGLDIFGDGVMKQSLMATTKRVGADVRFYGMIPNVQVPEILNRYSVFILPSLFEGSPKSLLEAMACGLACLGTAVDGIRDDVIQHGENGWLVNTDAASIRQGVRTLMEDKVLREKLGSHARRYIIQGFSLDSVEKLETSIHKRLIGSS